MEGNLTIKFESFIINLLNKLFLTSKYTPYQIPRPNNIPGKQDQHPPPVIRSSYIHIPITYMLIGIAKQRKRGPLIVPSFIDFINLSINGFK